MTSDWITYVPGLAGVPPVGYRPGMEWEFKGASEPDDHFSKDTTDDPLWLTELAYRFRSPPSAVELEELDRALGEAAPATSNSLPEDDAARLEYPMFDGLLAYFPNALAEVSKVSKIGNDQHNPGQPLHWARGKSTDHGNKIMRHLIDAGGQDARGVRHTARLAWRALAMLQEELERDTGVPMSRGSQAPKISDATARMARTLGARFEPRPGVEL